MPLKITTKKRPKIGDIIEFETSSGYAYAQYTHRHNKPPFWGPLIRILPGIYKSPLTNFANLVQEKERFFVFIPLGTAVNQGLAKIVGHEEIPERCRPFPLFKCGNRSDITHKVETWSLWDGDKEWDVGNLEPEQYDLPIRAIWSHPFLISRIMSGWKPSDEV